MTYFHLNHSKLEIEYNKQHNTVWHVKMCFVKTIPWLIVLEI
jgi:hypothetical protein